MNSGHITVPLNTNISRQMQACRKIFLGGTLDALRSGTVGALRTLSDFNGSENKNSGIVGALRKIAQREIAVL